MPWPILLPRLPGATRRSKPVAQQQKTLSTLRRLMMKRTTAKLKHWQPSLGLSIVRGLVEMHGGEVWLESHAHTETQVYFQVPCAARARNAA